MHLDDTRVGGRRLLGLCGLRLLLRLTGLCGLRLLLPLWPPLGTPDSGLRLTGLCGLQPPHRVGPEDPLPLEVDPVAPCPEDGPEDDLAARGMMIDQDSGCPIFDI